MCSGKQYGSETGRLGSQAVIHTIHGTSFRGIGIVSEAECIDHGGRAYISPLPIVQLLRVARNSKQREKLYKIKRIKFSHATDYRKRSD